VCPIVIRAQVGLSFFEAADGVAEEGDEFLLGAAAEAFGQLAMTDSLESLIWRTRRSSPAKGWVWMRWKMSRDQARARCQNWRSVKMRAAGIRQMDLSRVRE
jgi:hypothetical protein